MNYFNNVYKDKKVLVTGHTGFKGSWLIAWLRLLGAEIVGISLDIPTIPSHFNSTDLHDFITDIRLDIRDKNLIKNEILKHKPDFLFHLAAQPLVRKSYNDPVLTWDTNLFGTINILESLRYLDKDCVVIIITSDKCYDNVEWVWGYRETDALGGPDPYSSSKGAAELAVRSFVKSYFNKESNKIKIATARAGNVIGGGDWAEDRIIPDCVKSWSTNQKVNLRNPNSTRPWQHVLEPLSGYLSLGFNLYNSSKLHGESFNFGPSTLKNYSVIDLVKEMSIHWDKVAWNNLNIEFSNVYESGLLKLNCDKALFNLHWYPVLSFEETVKLTANWYSKFYQSNEILELTNSQINYYCLLAQKRDLTWAKTY